MLVYSLAANAQEQDHMMDNKQLGLLIGKTAEIKKESPGYWEVKYKDWLLLIITDEKNNRMRIIAPVAEEKDVKKTEFKTLLEANFDRALDVKYAFSNGYLWSVFAHPLKVLTDEEFIDAMDQVFMLAATYGSTYQSTNMIFGGGDK